MTLNIGGGFSLLRWASSMVSSLRCAMPPDYTPSSPPNSDNFRACPFPRLVLLPLLAIPAAYRNLCGGSKQCGRVRLAAELRRFFTALAHPRQPVGAGATLPIGVLDAPRPGA